MSPSARRQERRQSSSYSLGVIIANQFLGKYNSFYMQLHQLIAAEAIARESFAMMEGISHEMELSLAAPKIVRENRADGIIIVGKLSDAYLDMLREEVTVPMIYLDFTDRKFDSDAVISDSYYGAYVLTNYLFEMGHSRIAYVGSVLATGSITDRYLGYLKSMMEHHMQVLPEWVIDDRDINTGKIDGVSYCEIPDPLPDAFICNCDLTASVMVKKLEDRGLRIPRDVSIVGYDSFLYPGLCDVALTTYEVDMEEMARRTVKNLLCKIRREPYRKGTIIIEGKLLIRDSVLDRRNRTAK